MKIYEIGTGYTPIPAQMGAATEIVVEELTKSFLKCGEQAEIIDIAATDRAQTALPIREVKVPKCFCGTDVQLGLMHKLKRVVYSVALANELKKILKQTDEKVVLHFHNQYNLFFFLKLAPKALRRKCKIAYTNHSGIWRLAWEEIEETIKKRYFQEAECMRQADVVFLLNPQTKQNVLAHLGVPEERIVVINNGVNTDVYHPLSEEEKRAAREKWGLKDCRVILQVGSVYENKGQLRSLNDLATILQKNADAIYAYVGGVVSEEYQKQIAVRAKELKLENQVKYLGAVSPGEELNQLYNIAKATMFASEYEGFSLVIIESLSCGIPVLMRNTLPFSVGDGCVCFSSNKPDVITERILSCDDSTYSKLCTSARDHVLRTYSWDKIAEIYVSYFQ